MALINDGSQALKDEIQESYLRVKAAKHGVQLRCFSYFVNPITNLERGHQMHVKRSKENSTKPMNTSKMEISRGQHQKSKSFFMTETRFPTTEKNSSINHSKINPFRATIKSHSRREPRRHQINRLKLGTSPELTRRFNGVSYKFNREMHYPHGDQRRKIRMVSLIDSKPITHYITLLTLKEFSK